MKKDEELTVNQRIMLLKKELNLTDLEFCYQSAISTGTYHRIRNGEKVSEKVLDQISHAFNMSDEWLLTGKGPRQPEMAFSAHSDSAAIRDKKSVRDNPYRDALILELKEQITYLQDMLKMAIGNSKPNFPSPLYYPGSAKTGRYRAAA